MPENYPFFILSLCNNTRTPIARRPLPGSGEQSRAGKKYT